MHKYLIALLALAMLFCFVACQNAPEAPTTTQPTPPPGLNTTPSGFVGFDDNTAPSAEPGKETTGPTEATTEPTEATTEPTTEPTEPKPTDPKPTDPAPTEPTQEETQPSGVSIAPTAEGLILFSNLSKKEQQDFFMEFGGDPVAFDAWLDMAKAAFKEKYPDVVYDGGPIILPEDG